MREIRRLLDTLDYLWRSLEEPVLRVEVSSKMGGPTSDHYAKIEEYKGELKHAAILAPDIETQIQDDLQEIHENSRRWLNGDQQSE